MTDIRSFLMGTPKVSSSKKPKTNDKSKSPKKQKSSPNSESNNIVKAVLPTPLPKPKSAFEYAQKDKNQHTDTPPHLGEVEIPIGSPNCLEGIIFSASGTLNSITRQQLREIISKYGGKLTPLVSSKIDVFIRGVKDVSRDKLEKARDNDKTIIDEEGFFYIIRKSNPEANNIKEPEQKSEPEPESNRLITTPIPPKPKISISPFLAPDSCPTAFSSQEDNLSPRPDSQPTSITIKAKKESIPTLFTEKYRPKLFSELVGNEDGIKKLRNFLKNFDKEQKKSVIIYGPPGIGKTTSAIISAKSEGYHIIEFNASDTRNKTSIEKMAKDVFDNQTLFKYNDTNLSNKLRSCVIFDEIDGMSTGDRGGLQALAKFIETSRIPVICICNDGYDRKLDTIKKISIQIPFTQPSIPEMAKRLDAICKAENIKMNVMKFRTITNKSGGDIRSALNTLQLWASGVEDSSQKDSQETDTFQAVVTIFRPKTDFEQKMNCFFVDYDSFPVFIHHYCTMNDRIKDKNRIHTWFEAIDSMAYGCEIEHTIRNENAWDLLNPLAVVSSVIPATLCPKYKPPFRSFPDDYRTASTLNSLSQSLRDISMRCRRNCGASSASTFRDSTAELIVNKFNNLIQNNENEEALQMLDDLELTKDDLIHLQSITNNFKDFSDISAQFSEKSNKSFSQLYKQNHPEVKNGKQSNEEERADFYIKSVSKVIDKKKKKK